MEIGNKGLKKVNLTIPQKTSLRFYVVHEDEEGNVIDHSESTFSMKFQSYDRLTTYDLDECCSFDSEKIIVDIGASKTEDLPLGDMNWDLIVGMGADERVRICYGKVSIVDTYALDGE